MRKFDVDRPDAAYINSGSGWAPDDGRVTVSGGRVTIAAGNPVSGVRLFYKTGFGKGARFLGDGWERGYGDLEWRGMIPERLMPWYFAVDEVTSRSFMGVKTGCAAFVGFSASVSGVTVDIDTRSGSGPVRLENRALEACEFVCAFESGLEAYDLMRQCLAVCCPAPKLCPHPVYGGNNWYYAYGKSSRGEILADADFMSRLAGDAENRPYMVIDDGWQKMSPYRQCNGGPWVGNDAYGDMALLAKDMREAGARPGVWIRPLLTAEEPPKDWTVAYEEGRWMLDPSRPEVLESVRETVRYLKDCGYEMIKHDFSTYDMFAKWGCQVLGRGMPPAHKMADDTLTNAEIILNFYRAISEAAGDTRIIGCNTVSHLAAGLFQLQRTGDDTSGRVWERTRRMGVNTLAMRMPQHRLFYDCDADCAPITGDIDWALAGEWLRLLADSGTPLFLSARPGTLTKEQETAVRAAFRRASVNTTPAQPLDWQDTTCPRTWLVDGEVRTYALDAVYADNVQEIWWR